MSSVICEKPLLENAKISGLGWLKRQCKMVWSWLISSSLHGSEKGFGENLTWSAIARWAEEAVENLNLNLKFIGRSSLRLGSFLLK